MNDPLATRSAALPDLLPGDDDARAGWWGVVLAAWILVTAPVFAIATLFGLSIVSQSGFAGLTAEAGTASWGVMLASHSLAWGMLAAAVTALVFRRRLGRGPVEGQAALLVLAGGLVAAAAVTFTLHERVRVEYGLFDPEYAGFTIFVAPVLVVASLAGAACLAVPRAARAAPAALTVLLVAGWLLAAATNLAGVDDGVDPESVPLAGALLAAAAWSAVTLVAVVRSAWPGVSPRRGARR